MCLDPPGNEESECPVPDAWFVKRLAQCRHFADRQQATNRPQVGLNDVISIVYYALSICIEAPETFTAGDQNVHFPGKPRRAFEIVSRKRLFQPVDTGRLQRLGGGFRRRIVPNL